MIDHRRASLLAQRLRLQIQGKAQVLECRIAVAQAGRHLQPDPGTLLLGGQTAPIGGQRLIMREAEIQGLQLPVTEIAIAQATGQCEIMAAQSEQGIGGLLSGRGFNVAVDQDAGIQFAGSAH